jgi:release factor glutamine methyltransferase
MKSFSIAQALVEATQLLRKAGIEEARRDAATLLADLIGRDSTYLIAHAERELTASDVSRYRGVVERRAAGEPLQYINGHQEFFNLDYMVTPDVLIPRPDTELLVETALELIDKTEEQNICDVGTGSGCIAISILYERPLVRVVALDISQRALDVAERNATRHNVRERLELVVSDCFAALEPSHPRFHLIASNPPYIPEATFVTLQREVRDHEPRIALTPNVDGLAMIRRLLADAPAFLLSGGYMLIEIGFDQHHAVREMIDQQVWKILDFRKDIQGFLRTVVLKAKG